MRIEREGLGHAPLSHRDEGHGVNKAQEPLTPLEPQVETSLVERLVYPHHLEERREVCAKTSNCVETESPADERVRFDEHKRRRDKPSLSGTQTCESALRAGMVFVF